MVNLPKPTNPQTSGDMRLVVLHYHLRPGGVRRVIDLAVPEFVRHSPVPIRSVHLVTGECLDASWFEKFRTRIPGTPTHLHVDPHFRYTAEQNSGPYKIRKEINSHLIRWFGRELQNTIFWAHNLGIGRNVLLAAELKHYVEKHGGRLISHHHDLWFDNRWMRWSEFRQLGFRTTKQVATALFGASPHMAHATINSTDYRLMKQALSSRAACFPNPSDRQTALQPSKTRAARAWLRSVCQTDGPIFVVPCRLLRRKNLAEAILLSRWLHPESCLATTAGVSSQEEARYGEHLFEFARQPGSRVRFAILDDTQNAPPPAIQHVIQAADAILLTSVQEGFGLPFIEASALHRPLIARQLPNIAPDLRRFGFRNPLEYRDVIVPTELFSRSQELKRQEKIWRHWRSQLPLGFRPLIGKPFLLENPDAPAIPFSRLTLRAQLEILALPPEDSLAACLPQNRFLGNLLAHARRGNFPALEWPPEADTKLSGQTYSAHFWSLSRKLSRPRSLPPHAASEIQNTFVRERLRSSNLYPLLMTTDP